MSYQATAETQLQPQVKRLLAIRLGVGARLLLAFFAISGFAILAAAAAIYAFWGNREVLDSITEQRVPSALDSLELSRQAERIVAAAPALLTVASPAQHAELSEKINLEVDLLGRLLVNLKHGEPASNSPVENDALRPLVKAVSEIRNNLNALDRLVAGRLNIAERKKALTDQLLQTHTATQKLLAPWMLVTDAQITKARRGINDSHLTPEERAAAATDLSEANIAFRALQKAQQTTAVINNTLLQADSAQDIGYLNILSFRLEYSLREVKQLAATFHAKLRPLVLVRLDEFNELTFGNEGIPHTQERELALLAQAEQLLDQNARLSLALTKSVDSLVAKAKQDITLAKEDAHFVQSFSMAILLAVVVLALTSSVLIVWLYVGRNLVHRLKSLSASMLAIADGNLVVDIPTGGRDEIASMADALTVFRDTAVEVRATNLREIREARRRLTDAIESISEGFSLFDADDRLIVRNSRYEAQYPGLADMVQPGVSFEAIIRTAEQRGVVIGDPEHAENRIKQRLARHRHPGQPFLQCLSDGRWIQISERKTGDGGTVAVFTDVTELKRHEEMAHQAKEQAERTLQELKQAQNSLVQAEKLALLGQLAAGIAHEIKNPLNFVTNFAQVSTELVDELQQKLENLRDGVDEKIRIDIDDLFATLTANLGRIEHHGLRADRIVRSMLAHSRGGSSDWRATDINALIEESLNLAYHGARATDPEFDILFECDFDQSAEPIEVVPQDISRVLLNLLSNAFHATREQKNKAGDPAYQPTLKVTTRDFGACIEIRVRDNGAGIPMQIIEKIFTPFFTTKPAGEGTGLGLSLSYDIVVHEHHGRLDVNSREGEYTEFVLALPRLRRSSETGHVDPEAA